ncbi:MAG: PIN domain-containing protein [Deltaproteobacteria bacterium]|nr:PIN domain-containing protein [Deltaproteobacteria bacterium]
MTGPHFVDSNVLVYRHDRDEPERQARARRLLEVLWRTRSGRVSDQVLHEFYVVATCKLAAPVPREVARREVRQLLAWRPVATTPQLREHAWEIEDRHGLSWWDALIVAAAQAAGCADLFTKDLQDGIEFDGVRVVNPFRHELAALGLGVAG